MSFMELHNEVLSATTAPARSNNYRNIVQALETNILLPFGGSADRVRNCALARRKGIGIVVRRVKGTNFSM